MKLPKPKYLFLVVFVIILIITLPFLIMQTRYRFFNNRNIEPKVAIVFGAGLYNNYPSKVLSSRLNEAVKLYNDKKINKILVSGDNTSYYYNEPLAMYKYLRELGVADSDIVQDFAGRRTADTCFRAKNVFKINSTYLISQPSHLPRALWLCESYGIESLTVGAPNMSLGETVNQYFREVGATFLAVFESSNYSSSVGSDGTEVKLE